MASSASFWRYRVSPKAVEALAPSGRQKPGGGFLGHAVAGPMLERLDHRLRHELLGEVEVAEEADQARRDPARLLSKNSLQVSVRLSLSGHVR